MAKDESQWLVTAPEGQTFTSALTVACRGNANLANLLQYFLHEAAKEAKWKGIDKEKAEYIEIDKKLNVILDGLKNYNRGASKKTIIARIVKLQSLGYLQSEKYSQVYRVYFSKVIEAIKKPPTPEKPPLRGIHARKAKERQEDCTLGNSPESTMYHPESTTLTLEASEEIVLLRKQVESLQSNVVNLHSGSESLQRLIVDLHSELAHERTCREALEAKVASLYSSNIVTNTASKDTPASQPVLHSLNGNKKPTESPSQTTLPFKPMIVLSPEEQAVFDEWQKMPWFKGVPQKVTANTPQYCRKLAPYNPTVETMKAVKKWATSSEVDKRSYYKGKAWSLYFLAEEYPKWLSTQADNEPTPFPSDNKEPKKVGQWHMIG